jgi:hypothetical protein
MPRKHKFIVNRRTWRLHQFEFSVPCSYQECLTRLRTLEFDAQINYIGDQKRLKTMTVRQSPSLTVESDPDSQASAFELVLQGAVITGTVESITDESTLIFGLSQFKWDVSSHVPLYVIMLVLLFGGIVVALIPLMSAYVSPYPNSVWSPSVISLALLAVVVPWIGMMISYVRFRPMLELAVNKLRAAFDDCTAP